MRGRETKREYDRETASPGLNCSLWVECLQNWLSRRMMSACRIAGIIHGLDVREEHETGDATHDVEDAWQAALNHGFLPSPSPLLVSK